MLENLLKYGFLVRFDVPILFMKDPTAWPSLLALVLSNLFIFVALYLEKLLEKVLEKKIKKLDLFIFSNSKSRIGENSGKFFCFINIFTALLAPAIYLWYREANPGTNKT